MLLGAGISGLVHAISPLPTYVSAWSVVTGLLFSAAVGVFFGLYPAMRASRLDPVDSLLQPIKMGQQHADGLTRLVWQ